MNLSNDTECYYCDSKIVNGICTICGAYANEDSIPNVFLESNSNYKNDDIQINKTVNNDQNCPEKEMISNLRSFQIVAEKKTFIDSKEFNSQKTESDINVDHNNSYVTCDNDTIPWACVYCGFENINQNLQNCTLCEQFQPNSNHSRSPNEQGKTENSKVKMELLNDKWICAFCTFRNEKSDKICQVCLEICKNSDGEDIDIEDIEEIWLCKKCSSKNSFEYYKCKSCKSLAPFFNKWKCEKCSFFNDKLNEKCQICSNKNLNLIPCLQCKKEKMNKQYDELCVKCAKKNENSHTNFESQSKISQNKFQGKNEGVKIKNYKNETNNRFLSLPQSSKNILKSEKANSDQLKETKNSNIPLIATNGHRKFSSIPKNHKPGFGTEKSNNHINIETSEMTNQQKKNKKLKVCKKCKKELKANENQWCSKCEMHRWFCVNEACNGINFKKSDSEDQFCDKCKAKKGSDFSNCKSFEIFENNRITLAWQCGFCLQFSLNCSKKCTNNECGNLKIGNNYRVCSCNWVNLSIKEICQKCDNLLDTKV